MNKLQWTLAFIGIIAVTGAVHELVHVAQSIYMKNKIIEVCALGYTGGDFFNSALGWVEYRTTNKHENIYLMEIPAYIIQMILFVFLFHKCIKRNDEQLRR